MTDTERELIKAAVVRLRARTLALVFGFVGSMGLFLATVSLVIRGGENVGQHLGLLRNYCPGYSVTWPGAFVGILWGFLYGALLGYAIAWFYNFFSSGISKENSPGHAAANRTKDRK